MFTWWTLVRWLHISGAIIWVGGITFVVLVLRPALRQLNDRRATQTTLGKVVARMRSLLNVVIPIQVATGTVMVWFLVDGWDVLVGSQWGQVLLAKLVVVTLMLLLYYVVPRLLLGNEASPIPKAAPGATDYTCPTEQAPSAKQKLGQFLHVGLMVLGFGAVLLAKLLG